MFVIKKLFEENKKQKEGECLEKREVVRSKLKEYRLTYPWMISQLAKKGVRCDKSSLCEFLLGRLRTPKAQTVIDACHEILLDYEKGFLKGG